VYQITVTARGYYSQGDEMYEIPLDLEQKPAMIEHFFLLKKTIIIIPCTVHFGIIMLYQPGPIKLSFLP